MFITEDKDNNDDKQLLSDIEKLQVSYSSKLFKFNYELFVNKWKAKKNIKIDEFLDYFETEWINSTNRGWYEGFTDGLIPSTTNGLESKNGKIKDVYTIRSRMDIGPFLHLIVKMVRNWSQDAATPDQEFKDNFQITDKSYELAFTYLVQEPVIKRIGNSNTFICTTKEYSKHINNDLIKDKYEKLDLSFDELNLSISRVKRVQLNRSSWSDSKCTCSYFLKNYFCLHIVAIACNEKIIDIPVQFKNLKISRKSKPGRKPKATSADTLIRPTIKQ